MPCRESPPCGMSTAGGCISADCPIYPRYCGRGALSDARLMNVIDMPHWPSQEIGKYNYPVSGDFAALSNAELAEKMRDHVINRNGCRLSNGAWSMMLEAAKRLDAAGVAEW